MQNTPNFNLQAWKALQIVCVLGSYSSMAPCWDPSVPTPPHLILSRDCVGGRELNQDDTEKYKKVFLGESILPTWNKNRDQKVFS